MAGLFSVLRVRGGQLGEQLCKYCYICYIAIQLFFFAFFVPLSLDVVSVSFSLLSIKFTWRRAEVFFLANATAVCSGF